MKSADALWVEFTAQRARGVGPPKIAGPSGDLFGFSGDANLSAAKQFHGRSTPLKENIPDDRVIYAFRQARVQAVANAVIEGTLAFPSEPRHLWEYFLERPRWVSLERQAIECFCRAKEESVCVAAIHRRQQVRQKVVKVFVPATTRDSLALTTIA